MANPTSKIIDQMMDQDFFSQWLNVKRIEEGPGYCTLEMTVRKEMLNGFGILHGGVSFAFADSAFAFASNSRGRKAVSIETSITHFSAGKEGDVLRTYVTEQHVSNKIGTYLIEVRNQAEEKIALFKGTVYRTSKEW
ncbi:MAG: hotdog fold thioesterase [Bacteroidota bacterium]